MHQNQAKLFHENITKSFKTYATITYYGVPECIKISQKSPKKRVFSGPSPPGPPLGFVPGRGGRKRSVSHPGVRKWWPIYISRSFSARPLNVK